MSSQSNRAVSVRDLVATVVSVFIAGIIGLFALTEIPASRGWIGASTSTSTPSDPLTHDDHDHDHAHDDHEGHDEATSIQLSVQARANLRLRTQALKASTYIDYVEVPGVVSGWPGRTHISITSPLTGVINSINVSRGEMIRSGTPLFTLRLTHQDLVNTQETFLAQLGQLDVEEKEIERLGSVSSSGAIAGKTRLAREYERDKLLAGIRAARQAMLLHGLSEDQIRYIERRRELVREVTVYAPIVHGDNSLHHDSLGAANDRLANSPSAELAALQPPVLDHPEHMDTEFLVTELETRRGESVAAGQQLAQLSDYTELLIEGYAYQRDADVLRSAATDGAAVQAVWHAAGDNKEVISDLKVVYISNEIDRESRLLAFYVAIENKIERTERRGEKTYVSWRYKPGQRMTLRLPVSQIDNAIVVPKEAVAEEGPERYLFVQNGDHFDRVPVEVLARDSVSVAIKNDGHVRPGLTIATSGAHQLQMAMKNKAGGAVDPHAGHQH